MADLLQPNHSLLATGTGATAASNTPAAAEVISTQQSHEGSSQLPNRESLGRWTLVRMAALLAGIGALFLALSISILDQRFDAFDEAQYHQELIRVAVAFQQDQSALENSLRDYANWDDSYSFIQKRTPSYLANNYTTESVVNLRTHAVVFLDNHGQYITGLALGDDGTLADMPTEQVSALMPFFNVESLRSAAGQSTQLQWVNDVPVLVAVSKITETASTGKSNGYMAMLRHWDAAYLSKMRSVTAVDFTLDKADDTGEARFSAVQDNNRWDAKQKLAGLPVSIGLSGPTRLQGERDTTTLALLGNAIALIGLSLLGIYLILKRRVLNRLSTFSQLADRHRVERDPAIRWPVQGNDELDNLGLALNDLMGEVQTRHAALKHLAYHDPLTQIGNRRMLMDRLEAVQNRCKRMPSIVGSLMLMDLDGFKVINDGMGHTAGDQVLQAVAERAAALVRNYDTAVRLGGDEFAILLEDIDPQQALAFGQRLLAAIEAPLRIDDHIISVRVSLGIAVVDGALSNEDVLRNADLAMYEAKRRGKGQLALFDAGLLNSATRRVQLVQALQRALDDNQLEVWFQPIVNPLTGRVTSMEALLRWSFNGTYVPPDEFIPIAESDGMIAQLGRFVFNRVGAAMTVLRAEHPSITCSINISIRQFRDTDLVAEILEFSRAHALPAEAVQLELTESIVAQAKDEVLPTMRALVEHGYSFHLDDFGTGYSSLDRLREFPFDTLKVDRSFVLPINAGEDVMVRHIIGMAQALGLDVIAEGVETPAELNLLMELGCTKIQGYYFARPMPLHDLRAYLKTQPAVETADQPLV